jgi:hypothetical protein
MRVGVREGVHEGGTVGVKDIGKGNMAMGMREMGKGCIRVDVREVRKGNMIKSHLSSLDFFKSHIFLH